MHVKDKLLVNYDSLQIFLFEANHNLMKIRCLIQEVNNNSKKRLDTPSSEIRKQNDKVKCGLFTIVNLLKQTN